MARKLLVILLALGGFVCFSGPLFCFRPPGKMEMTLPVTSAGGVDEYLAQNERGVPGLRPGLAKSVIWADGRGQRSKVSLVYIHGFSASRRDISPVVERLAADMKANVFFTRLKAHGLESGDGFADVKAVDWYNDAREAFAIGSLIGEQVILVGTSTGGLLATLVALDRGAQAHVGALILLSPNFGLKDWRAQFISGPLGKYFARALVGRERITQGEGPEHARVWTERYRSEGIVALMDLTNSAQGLRLVDLSVPTLILYTSHDQILNVDSIRERFASIVDPRKALVEIPEASRHELTGDVLAPNTVSPVLATIKEFLRSQAGM